MARIWYNNRVKSLSWPYYCVVIQMIERTVEVGLLLDCYENLLHERTRKILKDYFSYDLSLNEIADQQGISKQAVSDQIKRGEEKLHGYEEALGLLEKNRRIDAALGLCIKKLETLHEKEGEKVREEVVKTLQEVASGLWIFIG